MIAVIPGVLQIKEIRRESLKLRASLGERVRERNKTKEMNVLRQPSF